MVFNFLNGVTIWVSTKRQLQVQYPALRLLAQSGTQRVNGNSRISPQNRGKKSKILYKVKLGHEGCQFMKI